MEQSKAIQIVNKLKKTYPKAKCSLNFASPFQLVVAVILAAQCTDERVNKVTPEIFSKYKTIEDFAKSDLQELEGLIYTCGFYRNKAKNIKACANEIINKFNSAVPNSMEALLKLPGLGRKSANVVMLDAFNNPVGVAVDTHAKRISNRIGFSKHTDPSKIEQDLLKIIPSNLFKDVNHLLVWHGRNCCTAQKPKCDICPINFFCETYISSKKSS